MGELNRLRHAVFEREAELAAGVPVSIRPDEEPHLAERLESVIKSGAEAVGGQAAGLYLLDEHTSHLKLRAAWNLPHERLLSEPRPLRGAVADLEVARRPCRRPGRHVAAAALAPSGAVSFGALRSRQQPHDAAGNAVGVQ